MTTTLKQELNDRIESFQATRVDIPVLYHYTSMDAMLSILGNRTLRFTHYSNTNDQREDRYGKDLIIEELEQYLSNDGRDCSPEIEKNIKGIFDKVIDRLKPVRVKNGNDIEIYSDLLDYYIVCFSEYKDKLSQWRGYADDGRGVSIGFDRSLINHDPFDPIPNEDNPISLLRMADGI